LLTGCYYEIRVTSISFNPRGFVHISYDDCLTYDTFAEWHDAEEGRDHIDNWSRHKGRFLRWPAAEHSKAIDVWLSTSVERDAGIMDSPELRQRLLIGIGTYRLRWKERLIYLRRPNPDGSLTAEFTECYVRAGR
jgi:hypothetical protein